MCTKMLSCMLGIAALLAMACSESPPQTDPTTSTRELLATTVDFTFEQTASAVAMTIKQVSGGGAVHRKAIPIPAGTLSLRADASGALVLEKLEVEMDDIEIDAVDLPPAGLHLTDLRATLVADDVAEASWSADGTAAVAAVTATLTFEWSLVSDGRVIPLAPQRIVGIDLVVEVGPAADGGVSVTLRGSRDGSFLRPLAFDLSDLSIELNAQK